MSNLYSVIKNNIFTEFRFLEEVIDEAAIYQITLDVSDKCEDLNLVDESIEGLSGKLQYASIDEADLNARIDQEEFNVKPGIILDNGTFEGTQTPKTDVFDATLVVQ